MKTKNQNNKEIVLISNKRMLPSKIRVRDQRDSYAHPLSQAWQHKPKKFPQARYRRESGLGANRIPAIRARLARPGREALTTPSGTQNAQPMDNT